MKYGIVVYGMTNRWARGPCSISTSFVLRNTTLKRIKHLNKFQIVLFREAALNYTNQLVLYNFEKLMKWHSKISHRPYQNACY